MKIRKNKVVNHPLTEETKNQQKALTRKILKGEFEEFVFAGRITGTSCWQTMASCDAMQALWGARLIERRFGQGTPIEEDEQ